MFEQRSLQTGTAEPKPFKVGRLPSLCTAQDWNLSQPVMLGLCMIATYQLSENTVINCFVCVN